MWTKFTRLFCCLLACLPSSAQVYEWGSWASWSSCSEPCEAGIERRTRRCFKTSSPSEKLKHNVHRRGCRGMTLDYRFCHSQNCDSEDQKSTRLKITFQDAYRIRAEQCTTFDKQTYNGKTINWRPYMRDDLDLCKLYCLASGHKFYARLKNKVRDGTPCGKDYTKVCIKGNCQRRPSGCRTLDGPCIIEKRRKVIGVFNSTKLNIGYNFVFTIPEGATDITVEELTRSRSFLALKEHGSNTYYLNGHWMISLSKNLQVAGTKVIYKRGGSTRHGGEEIKAKGPLEKSLDVMLIYQRDSSTIMYSFFLMEKEFQKLRQKAPTEGQNTYFSEIRKEPGIKTTVPKNQNRHLPLSFNNKQGDYSKTQLQGGSVSNPRQKQSPYYNSRNHGFSYPQRPSAVQQSYDIQREQNRGKDSRQRTTWYGSSWIQFGGEDNNVKQTPVGNTDFPRRPILNQQVFKPNQGNSFSQTPTAENSKTSTYQRPSWQNPPRQAPNRFENLKITGRQFYTSDQERERTGFQTYIWANAGFTPCSSSCAGGIQSGVVKCVRAVTGETVPDVNCDAKLRPAERTRVCNLQPCPASWVPQQWKECSKSCGEGEQMRDLMCKQIVDKSGEKVGVMLPIMQCAVHLRPEVVRKCFLKPCPELLKPKWVMGSWSKCSVECGHGMQKRSAVCKNYNNETVEDSDCNPKHKPTVLKACYLGLCKAAWYAREQWSQCSKSCGTGVRSRPVVCARVDGSSLNERYCEDKPKPTTTEACNEHRCRGMWVASQWSKCSSDCGTGVQERAVLCVKSVNGNFRETFDAHCSIEDKPVVRKSCKKDPCKPSWFSTPWTKCSVTCGQGIQRRRVSCLDDKGARVGGCKNWERPQQRQVCVPKKCPGSARTKEPTSNPNCTDNPPRSFVGYCRIIKRINYCRIQSYRKRCCKTCSLVGR